MPERNRSTLTAFDADAAVEAALDEVGDDLLVAAEYTADEFELLYLSDAVVEIYDGRAGVQDVAEQLHRYLNLDFEERTLFEDLYPPAEDAYGFVTHTDYATVIRVLDGEEGLYLSVQTGVDTDPLLQRVRPVVRA
jgi:hypothetical protein